MIVFIKGNSTQHRDAFVICLRRSFGEAELLHHARVRPGTYAGELLSNLYDGLFRRSLELKHDYTRYFALEYDSFGRYLRKRFLWDAATIKRILKHYEDCSHIIYFQPHMYFLDQEYGEPLLKKLLKPGQRI